MSDMPSMLPQIGPSIGQQVSVNDAPFNWQSLFDWGGQGQNSIFGDMFSGKDGILGGFGSLADFGGNIWDIYSGYQGMKLAKDMWNTNKKQTALDTRNSVAMLERSRGLQRDTLDSMQGITPQRNEQNNPEVLQRSI